MGRKRRGARRGFTRRQFLGGSAKATAVVAAASALPVSSLVPKIAAAEPARPGGFLTAPELATLRAALARLIPAEGPADWSAADVGADDYIDKLLSGDGEIYAGGPFRADFDEFQDLGRVKGFGWSEEVDRLREVYRDGLAELDRRAGGSFAAAALPVQEGVLHSMDQEKHPLFDALYPHAMEGTYGHPVYRVPPGTSFEQLPEEHKERLFRPWRDLGYEGDVHGVRFPGIGDPDAPWNRFGGYAPEEMIQPGGSS